MEIEVFWNDLKLKAQEKIAKALGKTKEEIYKDNNFEVVPFAVVPLE